MTRNPRRNRTRTQERIEKERKNIIEKSERKSLNIKKVLIFLILPFLLLITILGIKSLKNIFSTYKITRNNPIRYYASFVNSNWGVIDSNGQNVIPNEYKEYIAIPNHNKDVFIITYDIKSKTEFSTRAINKNGNNIIKKQNIIPIEYENTEFKFDQHLLAFKENNLYGFIDYDGNIKSEAKYTSFTTFPGISNRVLIEEEGKKGVLNTELFETVVAPVYKSIEPLNNSENTPYIVIFDNLKGLTTTKNKTILPAEYKEIIKTNSKKYFAAKKDSSISIFDENSKEIVKNFNDTPIDILDDLIIARNENGKVGAKNFNGEIIIPFEFNNIVTAGLNTYITNKNNKYNISQFFAKAKDISKQEKDKINILEKDYSFIEYIPEGNFFIAKEKELDNIVSIYDHNFNLKLNGIIEDINYKSSFLKIKNGKTYKYYLFNFEEKSEKEVYPENNLYLFEENGKLGFMNDKNNIIVPAIYDEAKIQNQYGYIAVSRNNKWGSLDYTGKVIVEPTLDFKDFTKIEFINNYYLDKNEELTTFKLAESKNN